MKNSFPTWLSMAVAIALGAAVARALKVRRARARPASEQIVEVPWTREN